MKKVENFDEIFAQRGEQVQPKNMVKGEIYLTTQNGAVWISRLLVMQDKTFWATENLSISGFYLAGKEYENISEESAFFKATPDQVELLNSYRV